MTSKICILDNDLINQIAAGEVIENGASIVKELVENSLDAGASRIVVEVKGGGRHLIRVSDNGEGMVREDAILCFERHATSKVKNIFDFDHLGTMGFRGEALAAIASVSKIKMFTRHKEAREGVFVELDGNQVLTVADIPCDQGTSFSVNDLFFNTPARKKFLKSPQHDQQEIQKSMLSLMLANPFIDFDLIVDSKRIWEIPFQMKKDFFLQLKERIFQLLHPEIANSLIQIDFSEEGVSVKGFIGFPEVHRPNRSLQYIFLNRRAINSWLISQAVSEGYGQALPERRHPVFVLHLEIDPKEFDVNVHPQKKEVRFRQEFRLKKILTQAIASCFGIPQKISFSPKNSSSEETFYPIKFAEKFFKETQEEISYTCEKPVTFPKPVGLFKRYAIFLESPHLFPRKQGLFLMHLERAFSRVCYEKSLGEEKILEQQLLLIPLTLTLSVQENSRLVDQLESFQKMGFGMNCFAPSTWMIESFPLGFKESDIIDFIKKGLGEEVFALPIRTARYLSEKISLFEVESLLHSLFKCQQPLFSPKGEAIFSEIKEEDLK